VNPSAGDNRRVLAAGPSLAVIGSILNPCYRRESGNDRKLQGLSECCRICRIANAGAGFRPFSRLHGLTRFAALWQSVCHDSVTGVAHPPRERKIRLALPSRVYCPRLERAAMNLAEGTRRLALLLGVVGAILAGFASYLELQTVLGQRARHYDSSSWRLRMLYSKSASAEWRGLRAAALTFRPVGRQNLRQSQKMVLGKNIG
jgi:hypothetical protein